MSAKQRVIMLIDDDEISLNYSKELLENTYTVYPVLSGEQALLILKDVTPDLILLDIEMPGMDGYMVLNQLKQNPETEHIPVIFMTSYNDPGNELDCLSLGAVDFITKSFSPVLLVQRIENHIVLNEKKKELVFANNNLKMITDTQTAEINKLKNTITNIVPDVINLRGYAAESRTDRIPAYLAVMIDTMIKHGVYNKEIKSLDIKTFINTSRMRDIGNININDSILNKPGKLTFEEFEIIKTHTENGVKIINNIIQLSGNYSFLGYASVFAASHHERWDGSGYPKGLQGPDIPFAGRLLAIADVYDAVVSPRPYKQPVTPNKACEEIVKGSGTAFDPALVEIFKTVTDEFARIA